MKAETGNSLIGLGLSRPAQSSDVLRRRDKESVVWCWWESLVLSHGSRSSVVAGCIWDDSRHAQKTWVEDIDLWNNAHRRQNFSAGIMILKGLEEKHNECILPLVAGNVPLPYTSVPVSQRQDDAPGCAGHRWRCRQDPETLPAELPADGSTGA